MDAYTFEIQRQQMIDGSWAEVPVCYGTDRQILPETRSLLAAAAIIGPTLQDADMESLGDLLEDVDEVLDGTTDTGIIIEDAYSAGSVNITPEVTQVEIRETGVDTVPSQAVHDMFHAWIEHKHGRQGLSRLVGDTALQNNV